jgi:light-regulated signal transduction histidine kinase (bacteriophytochrome)
MAVTTHASGSQTCTTLTEHTLTANPETTAGVFQLMLDLNDLADAEDLVIRIKEKVQNSSGTQRVVWYDYVANVQGDEKIWVSPMLMLLNGWDMSIRATGTPVVPWSIRKG